MLASKRAIRRKMKRDRIRKEKLSKRLKNRKVFKPSKRPEKGLWGYHGE
jgi:hypothetical protein